MEPNLPGPSGTGSAFTSGAGQSKRELASDVDPQLIIDAVFGAIFYRFCSGPHR
jgi:hypothetical protein